MSTIGFIQYVCIVIGTVILVSIMLLRRMNYRIVKMIGPENVKSSVMKLFAESHHIISEK